MSEIKMKRRSLLQSVSMAAIGGSALLRTRNLQAAVEEATRSVDSWPVMERRRLGKTGFMGGRLVFGCGAALANGQANDLLEPAFDAGINVFDVGYREYYKDAQINLAPFLKKHRDDILLISKAPAGRISADDTIDSATAKESAKSWLAHLDDSLSEMQVEHIDAYYVMACNNPGIMRAEEILNAFESAKKAGKVSHLGVSTHEQAEEVLLAAADTGMYSLAQIAITPAGWYDWAAKDILAGSKDMIGLRPVLDKAREAGIGLIGMKAGRHLAGRKWFGWGSPDAYDKHYSETVMKSRLNAFQKSYAYVLANGLDAVNADMQVWQHLHENFIAATSGQDYFNVS